MNLNFIKREDNVSFIFSLILIFFLFAQIYGPFLINFFHLSLFLFFIYQIKTNKIELKIHNSKLLLVQYLLLFYLLLDLF
jgi:hypothetical protein